MILIYSNFAQLYDVEVVEVLAQRIQIGFNWGLLGNDNQSTDNYRFSSIWMIPVFERVPSKFACHFPDDLIEIRNYSFIGHILLFYRTLLWHTTLQIKTSLR